MLPAFAPHVRGDSAEPSPAPRAPEGRHRPADEPGWALVVAAEAAIRAHVSHALVALGYHPIAVAEPSDARMELLRQAGGPSLVVLDSDTRHALGLLEGVRHRQEVPVVVCGLRGSGLVRSRQVEADGFMAKPLDLARTIEELRATARRSPAQRVAIRRARRSLAAEG